MVGEDDRNPGRATVIQSQSPAQKWMVHVDHVHGLEEFLVFGPVAQGEIKAGVCERQARASKDAGLILLIFIVPERKHVDFVPGPFEGTFIQVYIICDAADMRLVRVHHHPDAHETIVQVQRIAVKALGVSYGFHHDGRISFEGANLVKLVLRNKEYEVRAGMTLLSALQKINVLPESVIATRDGEMILDDEILRDGDVIKLIAVISGG
jgi:sulfur carrier protein ThiS